MSWWPFWRRATQPDGRADKALDRANQALERAGAHEDRAEEVAQQARAAVKRAGRFTREIDEALRIRGV